MPRVSDPCAVAMLFRGKGNALSLPRLPAVRRASLAPGSKADDHLGTGLVCVKKEGTASSWVQLGASGRPPTACGQVPRF